MARAGASHITKCTSNNFMGPTPVSSSQNFQASIKKRKNLVRTRLNDDFKAKFGEVTKPLPYGAGYGSRTRLSTLEGLC